MTDVEKQNIRELSLKELTEFLTTHNEKAFRAKQIWQWIWQRGTTRFEEMTNLSKATQEMLDNSFFFDKLEPQLTQTSSDGTVKTRRGNRRKCPYSGKSEIHRVRILAGRLPVRV